MKIDPRRLAATLDDPAAWRVILLHGEDAGMVHAHANALTRRLAGSLDDPFHVTELAAPDHARAVGEVSELPFGGGVRVVRLRDATDAAAPSVAAVLAGPGPGHLVVEAAALPARSKLRAVAEAAPKAAAIACYPARGAAATAVVTELLAAAGLIADADARALLDQAAEAGRDVAEGQVSKAALLAAPETRITAEMVRAVSIDQAEAARDAVALAACSGDAVALDRLLADAEADGESATSLLRAASGLLGRLGALRAAVDGGMAARDAIRGARPPIFFAAQDAYARMLGGWDRGTLQSATDALWRAELRTRRTGVPEAPVTRATLTSICRMARRR